MKKMAHKKIAGFAVAALAGIVLFGSGTAQATPAANSGEGAAQLVAPAIVAAAAAQSAGIIGGAIGSALGGAVGGAVGGGPVVFNDLKNLRSNETSYTNNLFSSRALAGQSAGGVPPRLGMWAQAGYTYIDNNTTNGDFDGEVINFLVGIDYKPKNARFKDRLLVGIAFAYEDVNIDTGFNNGDLNGTGFTVAPYMGFNLSKKWAMDWSVGVSALEYDNSRNKTTTAITGSTDAWRLYSSLNVTGNFAKKKFRISPKVGILALGEHQESYRDSASAAQGEVDVHLIRGQAGATIGYRAAKGIEPFVSAAAEYDFNRNGAAELANDQLSPTDELGAKFTAGVNFNRKNITGSITGVTSQFKDETETWGVNGRIRIQY